jgi:hypothetical protein
MNLLRSKKSLAPKLFYLSCPICQVRGHFPPVPLCFTPYSLKKKVRSQADLGGVSTLDLVPEWGAEGFPVPRVGVDPTTKGL